MTGCYNGNMNISENLHNAMALHRKCHLDDAEIVYNAILENDPQCADALHLLGILKRQRGKAAAAIVLLEKACFLYPANRQFIIDCADCLRENKAFDEALAYYQRAAAQESGDVSIYLKMAGLHHEMGDCGAARKDLQRALKMQPDHVEALTDYAELARQDQEYAKALTYVERALVINPGCASGHNTAGLIYEALGNVEKAMHHYRQATRLDNGFAAAHSNLGNVLRAAGETASAIVSYRRALLVKPEFYEAYYNLGNCLRDADALEEAMYCFEAALRISPSSIQALSNYGETLQAAGEIAEAEKQYRKAVALLHGSRCEGYSNLLLCMNYNPDYSPRQLYEKHLEFGSVFKGAPVASEKSGKGRAALKKLRIGYVSPDFRNHPVARFIEPVLISHDAGSFEIFCYSDVARPDFITERLKKTVLHWKSIFGFNDKKAENAIREDYIDILVDCAGHTAGNRLGIFAKKPAPLQISYLGYPMTTGLAAMDYYVTDALLDSSEDAALYTEKLLRMEPCFCCYLPNQNAPCLNDLPAAQKGFVTFGSLHPLARLNDQVIDLWSGILKEIPASHLRIIRTTLVGAIRKKMETQFYQHDIDPKRVELVNEIPNGGHLSLYHGIDISLDTFPWSGHTTACESLWMGVPVVTLHGNRHAGRMVSSIMKNMGLDDWVAGSIEGYRAIAVQKASSIDTLKSLRARLRDIMASSEVCNGAKFTRKLEAAYRRIWIDYCGK
jgi:protein O-GlcNAc transferase